MIGKPKPGEMTRTSFLLNKRVHEVAAARARILGTSLSAVVRDALLEFAQNPVPELFRDDLKE